MDFRKLFYLALSSALVACGGDDGSKGKPGVDSLVRQTAIQPLDEACPYGGVHIESGKDSNRNGTLDESEIESSEPVCSSGANPTLNAAVDEIVVTQGLSGDASQGRDLPDIEEPLSQLGMKLFFSKALGGDQDSACVTCHHPFLAGGDALSLPVGVGAERIDLLGPGRLHRADAEHFDGGPTVPRNSPTTFNIGLWDQVMFHDGRVESLNKVAGQNGAGGDIRTPDVAFGNAAQGPLTNLVMAQALFPVTSPEEMRGFVFETGNSNTVVRDHLALRLQGETLPQELAENNWLEEFRAAFEAPAGTAEELITYNNIATALAAYERSQVFVNHSFRRYIEGNKSAMSGDAKLGALLFFGKAGCANCHTGDFFSDEQFHVVAMPQMGRGKGNDNGTTGDDDFGRFRETGNDADRYAFRTPSLLNVAATAPYNHVGSYLTLEEVVRHYTGPREAMQSFDYNKLDANIQTDNLSVNTGLALDQLDALRQAGTSLFPENIELSDDEVAFLVAFLESLTDPCVTDRACLSPWVPDESDSDPDGLRVRAENRFGGPL